MDFLQEITKSYLRNDLPSLQNGKKVEVIIKSSKSGKNNFFSFKGIIIKQRRKKKLDYAFTVLSKDKKVVVKQIFFYHSPLILEIKELG